MEFKKILNSTFILAALTLFTSCGSNDEGIDASKLVHDHQPITYPLIKVNSNRSWPESWSREIDESLGDDRLKMLIEETDSLKQADLNFLGCPNLKSASFNQKRIFWIVFFSSIAKPESDHNPKDITGENLGLLQIDVDSANRHCEKFGGGQYTKSDMLDPQKNLRCGLFIMKNQVNGGKTGRLPSLKGTLFPSNFYYWEVLTRSWLKEKVRSFFAKHLNQMPFCK